MPVSLTDRWIRLNPLQSRPPALPGATRVVRATAAADPDTAADPPTNKVIAPTTAPVREIRPRVSLIRPPQGSQHARIVVVHSNPTQGFWPGRQRPDENTPTAAVAGDLPAPAAA